MPAQGVLASGGEDRAVFIWRINPDAAPGATGEVPDWQLMIHLNSSLHAVCKNLIGRHSEARCLVPQVRCLTGNLQ
jgi:hypothetical protein